MHKKKKTRKEKIAEHQKRLNKKKPIDKKIVLFKTLFFLGIILTGIEISIFRKTIIHEMIPISISLITGIGFTYFNSKILKIQFDTESKFWQLLYNTLTFGGIILFVLMYLNYKSPNVNLEVHKFEIIDKSSMGRATRRRPIARIDYFGLKQEIIFGYKDTKDFKNADSLILKIKKGNLGFDVIVEKQLIRQK